jgi:hypothetical protein
VLQSYEIVTHFQNDRFHGIVTHYVRTKFLKRTKFWKRKKKKKKRRKKKKKKEKKRRRRRRRNRKKNVLNTPLIAINIISLHKSMIN